MGDLYYEIDETKSKEIEFRKATDADIHMIMDIIRDAQGFLKQSGIDQWQDGYPNEDIIIYDIVSGNSYVLLWDGIIAGTAALILGEEKTYNTIYDGRWLSTDEYITIHRVAIDSRLKGLGLATIILSRAETLALQKDINSIRVDTHERNFQMQRLLKKNKFHHCGIIYLEDGARRLAYEKLL